jgi:arylsulfatase A-like enzyme
MTRPNNIPIMPDQRRHDTINALGFPHMQMPHLDRLAREGASFDACCCVSSSAMPFRASFFTAYRANDPTSIDAVFAEHGPSNQMPDIHYMTMNRTDDWKLVHYPDQPWGELYHLRSDPRELRNLWDNPNYADVRAELTQQIDVWRGQLTLEIVKGRNRHT